MKRVFKALRNLQCLVFSFSRLLRLGAASCLLFRSCFLIFRDIRLAQQQTCVLANRDRAIYNHMLSPTL